MPHYLHRVAAIVAQLRHVLAADGAVDADLDALAGEVERLSEQVMCAPRAVVAAVARTTCPYCGDPVVPYRGRGRGPRVGHELCDKPACRFRQARAAAMAAGHDPKQEP